MRASDVKQLRLKEILREYKSGTTQADLSRRYRVSTKTIRKWLTEAGLRRRKYQPYPERTRERAEKLYLDGYSVTDAAKKVGVPAPTVSRWLRSRGHDPARRFDEQGRLQRRMRVSNPPPKDNKKHQCMKHWTPEEKARVAGMLRAGIAPRVIFWQTGASKKRQRMIARELGL